MEAFVKILLGVALIAVVRQNSLVRCQAISVSAPKCYNTTTCPCCSVTCPPDGTGQCGGNCKDGYHGGKCWSRCPNNCIRCVDAQQGGGEARCTLCKDGYYSTATLYQCQLSCFSNCNTCESSASHCTSCNRRSYINEFHQCAECITQCETCTSLTNCTSCKPGFYKIETDCKKCNSLCYACNSSETCFCSNGCNSASSTSVEINCDVNTNECRFGCRVNFTSNYNNNKCDKCKDGNYGIGCDLQCPVNCRPTGCNRIDGDCDACRGGFHGDYCNQPCPVNCDSYICDKASGNCTHCKPGYFGKHCDQNCVTNCYRCLQINGSCTRCKDTFYGVKCTERCPPNCIDDKCNMTGHCVILSTITNPPTTTVVSVVPQESSSLVGPVAGGTVAAGLVVIIMVVLAVVFVKRRPLTSFKRDFNVVNLENYNFRLTDVLEENDEFDSTYFSCKVDDKQKPCGKLIVKELAKFVDTHVEEFYQEEFLKLPRGLIKPCEDAKLEKNILKNRYNGVYPYDEHRVKLIPPGSDFINACYIDQLEKPEKPAEGETEARTMNKGYEGINREGADIPGLLNRPLLRHGKCNYINAVYLNNYTVKDRFLICQTPLPNTVEDFLALITQESCSCIVSMDPPGVRDPTIGDYFSRLVNKTFDIPSGLYEVETQELRENPSYILRKLIIRHNQGNSESTSLAVYHYQCQHWPQENRVPEASHFLQLVLDVDAVADRDSDRGHVLVHCLNAADRSGLYCAVSNLVQKIKVEGEVSLINTLRQIKVRRPLAIPNKEQIQFCYQVVQQFLTRE